MDSDEIREVNDALGVCGRKTSFAVTFVIAETPTSTWNYHIRCVGPEGIKLGGGCYLVALCGAKLGWDTQIPFSAWGKKSHIPSSWCAECNRLHEEADE